MIDDGLAGSQPTSRRDFVRTAKLGIAGLAGLSISANPTPAQTAGNFPPPPPTVSPIEDLIDTHVHSGSDTFGRGFDDEEAAQLYKTSCCRHRSHRAASERAVTLPCSLSIAKWIVE
jgi:hypothetical protein